MNIITLVKLLISVKVRKTTPDQSSMADQAHFMGRYEDQDVKNEFADARQAPRTTSSDGAQLTISFLRAGISTKCRP